jgi:hypothetical protein
VLVLIRGDEFCTRYTYCVGRSKFRCGGSKWRPERPVGQWSQIRFTLMSSSIRICIEVQRWIRIHIEVKSWIRIRIKVMRIRNAAGICGDKILFVVRAVLRR